MDPKATAKSKRSHTQHGRKNHPPPAAQKNKKQPAPQTRPHPPLPSNWNRYGDATGGSAESEGAERNPDATAVGEGEGDLAPRSKGADFGYLVEQARSNPQDFKYSSTSSSFDDLSVDFVQGVSSILSVRGKNLLSWCEDDNFIVDDDPTSNYEVPILSMDLHALTSQLSKLKLSQRLFIEPELLPEELCTDEPINNPVDERIERPKATKTGCGANSPACLTLPLAETNPKDAIRCTFKDGEIIQGAEADQPQTYYLLAANLEPSKSSKPPEQYGRREVEQAAMPGIEAAASEAELDMLLSTFSETKISETTTNRTGRTPTSSTLSSLVPEAGQTNKDNPVSSRNMSATGLDDSIDALLAETSLHIQDSKQAWSRKESVSSTNYHHSLGSKSMVASMSTRYDAITTIDDSIDDLLVETSLHIQDTKQALPHKEAASSIALPCNPLVSTALVESIDALLAETSMNPKEQKHTAYAKEAISTSSCLPSHTSGLTSEAPDDFDSWLDTL
ncbi:uncharacterized protein M6B38_357695 [Iris pallida]|uniref:Uncharacterized protein n=1 Tax=Iris pallida TaxID=29817 RepID=A0AAX6GLQ8_IRIPA|nr:uncharacterized protein M6B38_357695 [Iris pallida]